ncbi:MAG: hypothetical protein Cons2KO_30450 [Congregibacter sp.]
MVSNMKKRHTLGTVVLWGLVVTRVLAANDPHTYTFNFNTDLDVDDGGHLDYHTGWLNGPTTFWGSNGEGGKISVDVSAWRTEKNHKNTEVSDDMYRWESGLGVNQPDSLKHGSIVKSTEGSPWHGVDNNPYNCSASYSGWCDTSGSVRRAYTGEEFLIFDFGEDEDGNDNLVNFHSFLFGYAREEKVSGSSRLNTWADATLLRGTGGADYDLATALKNNKATSAAGGFELVGNYEDVPDAKLGPRDGYGSSIDSSLQKTPDSGYSRYWGVGTLLTSLLTHPNSFDHLFEGAKLAQITVKTKKPEPPGEVPVPTTLALFLIGAAYLARRRTGAQFPGRVTQPDLAALID